jgi:hypothetical protein
VSPMSQVWSAPVHSAFVVQSSPERVGYLCD